MAPSGRFSAECADQDCWIGAQGLGNGQEFNNVQPAFAALVFRDEGLWFSKALCDVSLREVGVFPRLNEDVAKSLVLLRP